MSSHYVEAAQRLFALAVTHHFIQGRRTNNVVAACLYTICRRERSPRMFERAIAC
jgi:transcription factor IIIB subunit 2